MIKSVLFDMDGTVLDSEQIYRRAWINAFRRAGYTQDLSSHIPNLSGLNHQDTGLYLQKLLGQDLPYETIMDLRTEEIYRIIESEGLHCKPYVPEIFVRLHEMGIRTALVTSTRPERMNDFLDRSGLRPYFDFILSGNRMKHSKPDPDIYLLAAEKLDCTSEECVVVEDARMGIYAGYRAGMRVVMVPDLQPCTDEIRPMLWHLCGTLAELPTLIEAENHLSGQN